MVGLGMVVRQAGYTSSLNDWLVTLILCKVLLVVMSKDISKDLNNNVKSNGLCKDVKKKVDKKTKNKVKQFEVKPASKIYYAFDRPRFAR